MRIGALLLAVMAFVPLAACGEEFDPYATAPLAVAEGVKEAGPRVAICYNAMWTSKARVTELAQQGCAADRVAKPVETDWHLQVCPLLLPARANFVCAPKA
jgi:hypothetical protein